MSRVGQIRMIVKKADETRFSVGLKKHVTCPSLGLEIDNAQEGPRTLGELLEMNGYQPGDEVMIVPKAFPESR